MSNGRLVNFDALKVVSMFMIVVWHFYIHGMQVDRSFEISPTVIGIINCFMSQYLLVICSVCVDIYVLITGFFIISKEFRFIRIFRVWFISVFYGVFLTTIVYLSCPDINSPTDIIKSFFPVLNNSYWFVRQYIGLMIVSPFLSLAASSMRKDIYELLLLVFVIIGTTFLGGYPLGEPMRFMRGYSLAWFVVLFMVGGYFRRFGFFIDKEKSARYFFLLSIILWLYSIIKIFFNYFIYCKSPIIIEYSYNGIPFFLSVLLLCWLGQIKIKIVPVSKLICKISSLVFGVYLVHDNLSIRELIWSKFYNWTELYNSLWLIPISIVISLLIFSLCIMIEAIRKKIFLIVGIDYILQSFAQKFDSYLIKCRTSYLRK